MKRFIAAVTIAATLTNPALAGGMAEPVMEAEVIAEETNDSGGFIVPLLLLAVIVAVASSSGGGGGGGNVSANCLLACD